MVPLSQAAPLPVRKPISFRYYVTVAHNLLSQARGGRQIDSACQNRAKLHVGNQFLS